MRSILSLIVASWLLSGSAVGQVYNPYAKLADEPPISADGKLNWPSFFKSKALEDRFQAYFAMGSCVGTKQEINKMLSDNKVDVNQLPELSVRGLATGCNTGAASIADARGVNTLLMTHPAGVTKVLVAGEMPVSQLRPGMAVRFLGQVDAHGAGADPIDALEVFTPDPQFRASAVEAGRVQTIAAKVTRVQGKRLQVQVDAGKIRRLSFGISPQTKVTVDGKSLDLVTAGDDVTATGRAYSGPGAGGMGVVFASEIKVTKAWSAVKAAVSPTSSETSSASGN